MPARWWSRSVRGRPTCSLRSASKLPLAVKRGYHRHFRRQGNAALGRPVLDAENGYCLAPMEQGIRLTTGVEFAARDAPPTPVQFERLMPAARELFPLGEAGRGGAMAGARPCFADSRPVIRRAPRQRGLWLAFGHGHWGLTLGAGDRPAHCRNDDRRDAILRSKALRRGTICELSVIAEPRRRSRR